MYDVNILLKAGVNVKNSLELFGDMETYNDTLKSFLEDIDEMISNLTKYKEIADMANYAILVHSLKSDSKYFGFDTLAEISYKHELESKANNIYYIYDNFSVLMDELNRILLAVRNYLNYDIPEVSISIGSSRDKSILVVDDSKVIENFMKKILGNDYEVIVANDGKEAIKEISENTKIEGMLLDLNMPNVNGFEVLKYMEEKNLFNKIPTAIITGVGSDEIVNQVNDYPIIGILRKPFNEKDVKSIVDKIVNQES